MVGGDPPPERIDARQNVLLVTVDSLRADHVGFYGYNRDTTPFLDSLASSATVFEDAYAASVHTREAIPSILTGRYPSDAVTRTYRIRSDTIGQLLSAAGYETGAFVGSPFFTREFGYGRGFDTFDSEYSTLTPPMFAKYLLEIVRNRHYRDGDDINSRLVEYCENASKPFFAWAHYMDAHGPYNRFDDMPFGNPVEPRRLQLLFRRAKYFPSTITRSERQILVDHYDCGIRYLDSVLRHLFEDLESAGLLEETLVILVADHGESFGENGRYEHKRHLSEELLRVPLLLYDGDASNRVIETVSTLDVFATIADCAGVQTDRDSISLFERSRTSAIRASCLNYFRRQETTITGD